MTHVEAQTYRAAVESYDRMTKLIGRLEDFLEACEDIRRRGGKIQAAELQFDGTDEAGQSVRSTLVLRPEGDESTKLPGTLFDTVAALVQVYRDRVARGRDALAVPGDPEPPHDRPF